MHVDSRGVSREQVCEALADAFPVLPILVRVDHDQSCIGEQHKARRAVAHDLATDIIHKLLDPVVRLKQVLDRDKQIPVVPFRTIHLRCCVLVFLNEWSG